MTNRPPEYCVEIAWNEQHSGWITEHDARRAVIYGWDVDVPC